MKTRLIYLISWLCITLVVADATAAEFTLYQHYADYHIPQLSGKFVKKVVPSKDGTHLYILAHDAEDQLPQNTDKRSKNTTLLVYNHTTHAVTTLGLSGCEKNTSFVKDKTAGYVTEIGDIAITEDGYLVGISQVLLPYSKDNVYIYKWGNNANDIATGDPSIWGTISGGNANGNWNNARCGDMLAYDGTSTDGWLYYSAVAIDDDLTYRMRYVYVPVTSTNKSNISTSTPIRNGGKLGLKYQTPSFMDCADNAHVYLNWYEEEYTGGEADRNIEQIPVSATTTTTDAEITKITGNAHIIGAFTAWHTPMFTYKGDQYVIASAETAIHLSKRTKTTGNGLEKFEPIPDANITYTHLTDHPTAINKTTVAAAAEVGDDLAIFIVRDGDISKYGTATVEEPTEPDPINSFDLYLNYTDEAIPQLAGTTIKRVVPSKDGSHLYILAHKDNEPVLLVYNHKTKTVKETLQTSGCIEKRTLVKSNGTTTGSSGDMQILGNIDVTEDGVLVGIGLTVVPFYSNNEGVYLYKWNLGTDGIATGDAIPWIWTNTGSTGATTGNFHNTLCGEGFAYKGTTTAGYAFFSARTYEGNRLRWQRWTINSSTPGVVSATLRNNQDTNYGETYLMTNLFMDAAPNSNINFLLNSTSYDHALLTMSTTNAKAISPNPTKPTSTGKAGIPTNVSHTPIFEYQGIHYMVGATPMGVAVADLSDGITSPKAVTLNGAVALPSNSTTNVAAAGTKFDTDNLALFVVRDGKISKYSTTGYDRVFVGGKSGKEKAWNEAVNWNPAVLPTAAHRVLIKAPCEVNVTNAIAKSIDLHNNATLTVLPTGALTVQGTIRNVTGDVENMKYEDITRSLHNANQLIVEANASGQGVLAQFDKEGETPATVQLYGTQRSDDARWQYVAMPFEVPDVMKALYGAWLMRWNEPQNTWEYVAKSDVVPTFKGHLLTQPEPRSYSMQGILPPSSKHTFILSAQGGADGTDNYNGANFLGNSWVAPLQIAKFTTADFAGTDATIYTYRYQKDEGAGDYIETVIGQVSSSEVQVINPLQGFYVLAQEDGATITFDYEKLVSKTDHAQHSYRVAASNTASTEQKMQLTVTGDDEYYSHVRLFEREDYTLGFDNGFDGRKLRGHPAIPYLAAASEDGDMAVLATPSLDGTFINFLKGSDGTSYTFSFQYTGATEYQLEDMIANEKVDIRTGKTYTFMPSEDDSYRFRIVRAQRMPDVATDVPTVWTAGNKLHMTNPAGVRTEVSIYTVEGKLVKKTTTYEAVMQLHVPQHGVYIIQVRSEMGTRTIKCIL